MLDGNWRRWCLQLLAAAALAGNPLPVAAEDGQPAAQNASPFLVRGEIALSSLQALGDGHLRKMGDALQMLAETPEARSASWERIRPLLETLAERNVDALVWFARPDGSYRAVGGGKEPGNLASRPYFPTLLQGKPVLGALVVSKATGKSSAIVASPIRGADGRVVGVLGSSIYLDRLSARLKQEMGLGSGEIFYSFDKAPIIALNWDPALILLDPLKLEPAVTRAFEEMLGRTEGVVRYEFRDTVRTVLYRRSPVTGWWYAFGVLGEPEKKAAPAPR